MIPSDYEQLVNKLVQERAARRHQAAAHAAADAATARDTAERLAREIDALLEGIVAQWVAEDAGAARAEAGRKYPEYDRPPGRSHVAFVTAGMLGEMARHKRAGRLPEFRRLEQWVVALTGWSPAEVAGRLYRADQDLAAEGGAA